MTVRELISILVQQVDDLDDEVRFVDHYDVYDGDCAVTGVTLQKRGLVELNNEVTE